MGTESSQNTQSSFMYGHPLVFMVVIALMGLGVLYMFVDTASHTLQKQSVEGAAKEYAAMIKSFRATYTKEVVKRIVGPNGFNAAVAGAKSRDGQPVKIAIVHDYDQKTYPNGGAIPLPATLTFKLGKRIGKESGTGLTVKLLSALPFPWREEERLNLTVSQKEKELTGTAGAAAKLATYRKGLEDKLIQWKESKDPDVGKTVFLDDFQERAWDSFSKYTTEQLEANDPYKEWIKDETGRQVLRYATPDILHEGCVGCHNTRAGTPKTDWKLKQLRGMLDFQIPAETALVSEQGKIFVMPMMGIVAFLISIVGFIGLLLKRVRQLSASSENQSA